MVKRALYLGILASSMFMSCGDASKEFRLVEGQKNNLKEWPDSAYLAGMDSIASYEIVRAPDAPPPEVSISPMLNPINPLKGIKTGKSSSSTEAPSMEQAVEKGVAKRQEAFAQRFEKAMERLQGDPSNARLFQEVTLREGEDLSALMRRVYGSDADKLPAFVVKSQIESLNGGVVKAGQTVKVPKL